MLFYNIYLVDGGEDGGGGTWNKPTPLLEGCRGVCVLDMM